MNVTPPSRAAHSRGLLQLNLAVVLFGFTALFGKWLTLPALVIVFGRVVFAFFALLLLLPFTGQNLRLERRKDFGPLLLLGVFMTAHWVAFFQSVQVSSVAICLVSFSIAPVLIALLEPLFFAHEKFTLGSVILALVVMVGVAIATPSWRLDNTTTQGVLWGVASGIALCFMTLLNRGQANRYPTLVITTYQMGIVALLLLPTMLSLHPHVTARDLGLLACLGIVFTGVAQLLFVQAIKVLSARLASVVSSGMEVVYGVALAALFLHEAPAPRTLVGGAIIIAATLYAMSQHKPDVPLEPL